MTLTRPTTTLLIAIAIIDIKFKNGWLALALWDQAKQRCSGPA
jgi:hypothetical protein